MSKVYGIASFTGPSGITNAVCNDFTISATSEKKELAGNPASDIVDVRAGKTTETMTANMVFEAYVEPQALVGTEVTLTAVSDDTSPATATITGICTNAECRGSKDDWWTYSVTVVYVVEEEP